MPPEQLRQMLRVQPFVPFRIYLSGGQSYDVRGPEWAVVMGPITFVGIPGETADGDRGYVIANRHITHTEPRDEIEPVH